MEKHKQINWLQAGPDEAWDFLYDMEAHKDQWQFFKYLMNSYPDLDLDWISIAEDLSDELIRHGQIDEIVYFSNWCIEKFPETYAEGYEFLERNLINYYLYNNNLDGLRKRIEFISEHPVSGIDTLTIRLLFQLLYHGLYDDAVAFARKVYIPIAESEKIFGSPEYFFAIVMYNQKLQEYYEALLDGQNPDFKAVKEFAVSLGFDEDHKQFELIEFALNNNLDVEGILNQIPGERQEMLLMMNIHFMKHMFHSFQMPFVLSDCLWNIIATTKIFGHKKEVENWFYIPIKVLDTHLHERLDTYLGSNSLEIFGKVWGLHYCYDFLHKSGLLSDELAEKMFENIAYCRNYMMRFAADELWQLNFVHNWPQNHLWKDLRPIFESTYNKTDSESFDLVKSLIEHLPVPERINRDLKLKKSSLIEENISLSELEPIINQFKIPGRNEPCPCGSGKKYKKCCMNNPDSND